MAYISQPSGNYVKFIRGTTTAWKNIKYIDENTLYFISDADSDAGSLYLGSKLIGTGISGTGNLSDLINISISENIPNNSVLIYNSETQKWEDKPLGVVQEALVGSMKGATEEGNGTAGLVPAPSTADKDSYLRGDGTWANPLDGVKELLYGTEDPEDEDKTVREIAASEVQKIVGSASEDFDTLLEIEEWIHANEDVITSLANADTKINNFQDTLYGTPAIVDEETGDVTTPATEGLVDRVDKLEKLMTWGLLTEE